MSDPYVQAKIEELARDLQSLKFRIEDVDILTVGMDGVNGEINNALVDAESMRSRFDCALQNLRAEATP